MLMSLLSSSVTSGPSSRGWLVLGSSVWCSVVRCSSVPGSSGSSVSKYIELLLLNLSCISLSRTEHFFIGEDGVRCARCNSSLSVFLCTL